MRAFMTLWAVGALTSGVAALQADGAFEARGDYDTDFLGYPPPEDGHDHTVTVTACDDYPAPPVSTVYSTVFQETTVFTTAIDYTTALEYTTEFVTKTDIKTLTTSYPVTVTTVEDCEPEETKYPPPGGIGISISLSLGLRDADPEPTEGPVLKDRTLHDKCKTITVTEWKTTTTTEQVTITEPTTATKTYIVPTTIEATETVVQPTTIEETETVVQPTTIEETDTVVQPTTIEETETVVQPTTIEETETVVQPQPTTVEGTETVVAPTTIEETETVVQPTTIWVPTTYTTTTTFETSYTVTVTSDHTVVTTTVSTATETTITTLTTSYPVTETITAPGQTITAPGQTVTGPGETVTAPGATVTSPGETDFRVTLCPSPTGSSAPLSTDSDLTFGCKPGYVCNPPKPEGCNFFPGLPSDDFLCAPEDCIVAPPIKNTTWPEGETDYYPPTFGYFNLNPEAFGLSYDIFEYTVIEKIKHGHTKTITTGNWASQTTATTWPDAPPTSTAKAHERRVERRVARKLRKRANTPSVCFNKCDYSYQIAESIGKRDSLCDPGTSFSDSYASCAECITDNSDATKNTIRDYVEPAFAQYFGYCSGSGTSPTSASASGPESVGTEPPSVITSTGGGADSTSFTLIEPSTTAEGSDTTTEAPSSESTSETPSTTVPETTATSQSTSSSTEPPTQPSSESPSSPSTATSGEIASTSSGPSVSEPSGSSTPNGTGDTPTVTSGSGVPTTATTAPTAPTTVPGSPAPRLAVGASVMVTLLATLAAFFN